MCTNEGADRLDGTRPPERAEGAHERLVGAVRNLAGALGQVAEAVRAERSFKDPLDEINLDEIMAAVEGLVAEGYHMVKRVGAAAAKLKALGVKGALIKAAEQGYITQLACKMPECFCPEELGGACYFEPVTNEWSDWRSDWMPTLEHFPVSKREGGKAAVDNAILAHRLCNRLDHSLRVGRSHGRDLERIRKAREEGIRRNNVQIGNTEGGEIPTVEAEAATPKPKKTKKAPEWKSLPDAEKAQYLLDHQTISDRTWTEESRLKGEKRDAFIHRILGFPKTP
jgi:hypothetical protein